MAQAKDRIPKRGYARPQAPVKTERVTEYFEHTEDVRTVESDEETLPRDTERVPNVVNLEALGGPTIRAYLDPKSSRGR